MFRCSQSADVNNITLDLCLISQIRKYVCSVGFVLFSRQFYSNLPWAEVLPVPTVCPYYVTILMLCIVSIFAYFFTVVKFCIVHTDFE